MQIQRRYGADTLRDGIVHRDGIVPIQRQYSADTEMGYSDGIMQTERRYSVDTEMV